MQLEELYSTNKASISQLNDSESFILSFQNEFIDFKFCDLYMLKKKLQTIDVVQLLDADSPDSELIYLPHCDRFLLLSIKEILEFRELLNGAFDILALNSAIQKILRKNVFNF